VRQGYIESVARESYIPWQEGAIVGAAYALSKAARAECGVIITEIEGMITDTNPTIVAVATIYAVWNASGVRPITG